MPRRETYYDTLEIGQKGAWNIGRFVLEFALPTNLVDLATNKTGLFDLSEEIGMGNLMPNLEKPFANFGLSLLTLHMIANQVDFSEDARTKHSNGFVRFAAKTQDTAEKVGLRTLSAAAVFMAPQTTPEVFKAATDLLTSQEHPFVSTIMLVAGVAGAINSLVDITIIAGKLIETWENRNHYHEENVAKSMKKTEDISIDPKIRKVASKHRRALEKTARESQEGLLGLANGVENARRNEVEAADPGGLQRKRRLLEHRYHVKASSRLETLERVKLDPVESNPLPDSLLTSISNVAKRKLNSLMKIGRFYREHAAKNPQEDKPIIIREYKSQVQNRKQ